MGQLRSRVQFGPHARLMCIFAVCSLLAWLKLSRWRKKKKYIYKLLPRFQDWNICCKATKSPGCCASTLVAFSPKSHLSSGAFSSSLTTGHPNASTSRQLQTGSGKFEFSICWGRIVLQLLIVLKSRNPICLVRLLAIPQSNSCLAQHDPTLTLENFPVGTDPNLRRAQ
ncbi:hypothetical protein T09_12056 [Trichinella sp. T9]|nr:hypothetical protein T09_12056 [Trichinella sp. T9]